ncbi:hypothetical protein BGX29_000513 [Mortierella sp. GBA35]|nr:hypothetical protein BGX29_000513 [Mortierella sp. GBA35]
MMIFSAIATTLSVLAATSLATPTTIAISPRGLAKSLAVGGTAIPLGNVLHSTGLSIRSNAPHANTKVVTKALSKLKLNLCSDIHSKVKVLATGLLTTDLDLVIPKISAKVKSETNTAINSKVELDTKSFVLDKIHHHGLEIIHRYYPHADDRCLRKHARQIVRCVEKAVQDDVVHLFVALKANLMTHVRSKVAVVVRDLSVNLLLEQIHVQGAVDAVAQVDEHFEMCSHVIVKGLYIKVVARAVAVINSICRDR